MEVEAEENYSQIPSLLEQMQLYAFLLEVIVITCTMQIIL